MHGRASHGLKPQTCRGRVCRNSQRRSCRSLHQSAASALQFVSTSINLDGHFVAETVALVMATGQLAATIATCNTCAAALITVGLAPHALAAPLGLATSRLVAADSASPGSSGGHCDAATSAAHRHKAGAKTLHCGCCALQTEDSNKRTKGLRICPLVEHRPQNIVAR